MPKKPNINAAIRHLSVPVSGLTEDPNNARLHDEKNIEAIMASYAAHGQQKPIVVSQDNVVLAGNGQFEAVKRLGWSRIAAVVFDGTSEEAFALADNRTGELATWNNDVLTEIMERLVDEDLLGGTGFTVEDYEAMLPPLTFGEGGGEESEEEAPQDLPIESAVGEIYQLGPHRLVCGDSTDPDVVRALMGKQKAHCVCTDPPYGVDFKGVDHENRGGARRIANDKPADLDALLRGAFNNIAPFTFPGRAVYVFGPPGGELFDRLLRERGMLRQTLVWVKDTFVLGRSDYHYRHENIYYGFTPPSKKQEGRLGRGGERWYGGHNQDSVFNFDRPRSNKDHPTMKPPELIAALIKNHCRPRARVLDLFGGSGSLMVACASLRMHARMVEIDPKFCDVIRRRWTSIAEALGEDPGPDAL